MAISIRWSLSKLLHSISWILKVIVSSLVLFIDTEAIYLNKSVTIIFFHKILYEILNIILRHFLNNLLSYHKA